MCHGKVLTGISLMGSCCPAVKTTKQSIIYSNWLSAIAIYFVGGFQRTEEIITGESDFG